MHINLICFNFLGKRRKVKVRRSIGQGNDMSNDSKIVLIVDDEEDLREILSMHVEELGFTALTADNGESGLAALFTNPVDVVLSDLTMPKLNGIGFLRQARSKGYNFPFLVLTGNGTKATAMEAVRLGAFDFLEKPFIPNHLKSLLDEAMRQSKSQQGTSRTSESQDKQWPIRLPNLNEDSSSAWEVGQNIENFFELFDGQLAFCKGSIKNILDKEEQARELGYLYRVIRSCSQAARFWQFYDLSSVAFELSEMILFFRAHPEQVRQETAQLVVRGINNILNLIHNLQDSSSVMAKSFELREEIKKVLDKLSLIEN